MIRFLNLSRGNVVDAWKNSLSPNRTKFDREEAKPYNRGVEQKEGQAGSLEYREKSGSLRLRFFPKSTGVS